METKLAIYKRLVALLQQQRGAGQFAAMARAIEASDTSTARGLRSLIKGGYVKANAKKKGRYLLTDKGKATAPENVIDQRVLEHRADATTGGIREVWWRYLRNERVSSVEDAMPILVEAGRVTPHLYQDLNRYCEALAAAGYIKPQPGQTTKILRRIRWLMVRNTGQNSPKMSRDRRMLVDRNNGKEWPV